MADAEGKGDPHGKRADTPPGLDTQLAAQDWITIWQSELSALAVDREAQESWVRCATFWAEAAQLSAHFLPGAHDSHATRATPPAGATPPLAASDPSSDTLRRLGERVAELERLLGQRREGAGPSGT